MSFLHSSSDEITINIPYEVDVLHTPAAPLPPIFSYRLAENYKNRCCLVAQYQLVVGIPNLEVAKKKLFHQYIKISR